MSNPNLISLSKFHSVLIKSRLEKRLSFWV